MKLVVVLTALALAGPARSDAARRAEAAFEAGDYDTAATAAAEAYAADGDPVYLYVQAQAERFGGDCKAALTHYRQFIEAVPDGRATQAARDNIAECEQALAEVPPEPGPTGEPETSEEPEAAEPLAGSDDDLRGLESEQDDAPPSERRWYRDPWGGALVGVGLATLGAGVGLFTQARLDARAAERATEVHTYGDRIDRAYVLSRVGIPLMAVGGSLVIAGVVRWGVLARRGSRARAETVGLGPGGLVLRW